MLSRSLRFRALTGTALRLVFVLCLLRLAIPGGLAGQDAASPHAPLAGIPGVGVIVQISDAAVEAGYSEILLRTDVELRLRESGIRVFSEDELSALGVAPLVVSLNAFDFNGLMVYSLNVQLVQFVALVRNPAITLPGSTWETAAYGIVGLDVFSERMSSIVRSNVETFINAFLSVNP